MSLRGPVFRKSSTKKYTVFLFCSEISPVLVAFSWLERKGHGSHVLEKILRVFRWMSGDAMVCFPQRVCQELCDASSCTMVQDPPFVLEDFISTKQGSSGVSRWAFGQPWCPKCLGAPGAGEDAQVFSCCNLCGPGDADAKTSSQSIVDFPGKMEMLLLAVLRDFTVNPARGQVRTGLVPAAGLVVG